MVNELVQAFGIVDGSACPMGPLSLAHFGSCRG